MFDLHVDSIIQQRLFGYRLGRRHRRGIKGQPLFWHADIPRMLEGGYGGACMGVHYFPWESEKGWVEMQRQIAYLDALCDREEGVVRIRRPDQWRDGLGDDRLALAPGVEGAHMLNGKIERAETLARMGVSYLTLTHFSSNAAATASMGRGANEEEGLTAFGKELVRELNRVGVAVDVAHVNDRGVIEACEISEAPVFCTHTGVKGVYDHPRNISDEALDAIASTGGVVGVILGPLFVAGRLRADTEAVLDHYEYIVDRVGVEHVALGSDYDGWLPTITSDHRDCRDLIKVLEGLEQRGWGKESIAGVSRANACRAFDGVAQAARLEMDT